jgi:predicted nucleotide-binding protein
VKGIYGTEHEVTKSLSHKLITENINASEELEKRTHLLESYVTAIEKIGVNAFVNRSIGSRVFIGHGRSPIWRELKDFLSDRLELRWDEFNREAVAGITTFGRISEMLDSASFAFLVMTAEDQHSDTTTHARQNVVHEVGLFQGRLGPKKAIILLEEGCNEFSNIVGLSQIRFPKGQISAVFEEIRRVLEREGVIKT